MSSPSSSKKTSEESMSDLKDDNQPTKKHLYSNYERHLFLYNEETTHRPSIKSFIRAINMYDVAMPCVSSESNVAPVEKANLGTIAGVYLPCIQNILGVMFFLRLTWIVGTAGILLALLIVFLSCCVTFTTSISLSAIATNGIVPAGGSYFILSRCLGPEFGGAVGILFYLATTFAGSLYVTGAVEIFMNYMWPHASLFGKSQETPSAEINDSRFFGTVLLALIGGMVFLGVKFVSKLAPIALFCVLVSLLAVYVGVFTNFHGDQKLKICVLGDRLVDSSYHYEAVTCSKDPNSNKSLYHVYCTTVNGNNSCETYFEQHDLTVKLAIPGLASGVFLKNIHSYFAVMEDYVAEHERLKDKIPEEKEPYNQVRVLATTSLPFLIGVFFPSVTGIMAGSNRSGDLADASKSIPIGTIAAQITTSLIYLSGVLFFGGSFNQLYMRDKKGVSAQVGGSLAVANLAWPHPLVVITGSFLSTFGAGLQSIIGAPRLLQAIAKDEIIPFLTPFSICTAKNEPVRALMLTIVMCELGILIGKLDLIAPIQTMFFLMCYMFVNLACVLQSLLHVPNWRPHFKYYHWTLSLIGSLLCLVVMFLINWYYALSSIMIALFAYKYIEYIGAKKEWGDGITGLALSAARYSLLRVEERPIHTKNWRPQLLIFCKLDENFKPKNPHMFTFASQLKAGRGFTMIYSVIEGIYDNRFDEADAARSNIRKTIVEMKMKAFVNVLVAENVIQGMCNLIQIAGLGGMRHNTVVLGWPEDWKINPEKMSWNVFLSTIQSVTVNKKALLVPKGIKVFPSNNEKMYGIIDVWWIVHDGGLLILLPFLLKQHKTWEHCKLRVFTIAQLDDNSEKMKKDLANSLYYLRIDAEVEVVQMLDSDISAYTYERTLLMEQRFRFLSKLELPPEQTQTGKRRFSDVQEVVNHHHRLSMSLAPKTADVMKVTDAVKEFIEEKSQESRESCSKDTAPEPKQETQLDTSVFDVWKVKPDAINVRRMHTAVKLNEVIISRSRLSQLVVLNLPDVPKGYSLSPNYMEFIEALTEGLERVLMVRGGGTEVITIYS